MGTIEEFKKVFEKGVAKPNRYVVNITPPAVVPLFGESANLSFACESVELPGTLLSTQEDKLFGPIRKLPYLNLYRDLDLTFICSRDMAERNFFEAWLAAIIFPAGSRRARPQGDISKNEYKIEFYENYISTININILDEKNVIVKTITCNECYPIEIIDQPLSYAETNNYLKMVVRMAYRNWTSS